jgi:hypothetical protein
VGDKVNVNSLNLKFGISLIHNNENSIPARAAADCLEKILMTRNIDVIRVEIYKQGAVLNCQPKIFELIRIILRNLRQRLLEIKWRQHLRSNSPLKIPLLGAGFLAFFIKLLSPRQRQVEFVAMQIEEYLSLKHIAAGFWAKEMNVDFLIVLESDATWLDNSHSKRFDQLFEFLLLSNVDKPTYVDIAGGLSHKDLNIKNLKWIKNDYGIIEYERPFTNTTCGYIVSSSALALTASKEAVEFSEFYGADWLINRMFLELNQKINFRNLHMDPPGLQHGSFYGNAKSSNPKRIKS